MPGTSTIARPPSVLTGTSRAGDEQARRGDAAAVERDRDPLRPDGVDLADRPLQHHRVGQVVQDDRHAVGVLAERDVEHRACR